LAIASNRRGSDWVKQRVGFHRVGLTTRRRRRTPEAQRWSRSRTHGTARCRAVYHLTPTRARSANSSSGIAHSCAKASTLCVLTAGSLAVEGERQIELAEAPGVREQTDHRPAHPPSQQRHLMANTNVGERRRTAVGLAHPAPSREWDPCGRARGECAPSNRFRAIRVTARPGARSTLRAGGTSARPSTGCLGDHQLTARTMSYERAGPRFGRSDRRLGLLLTVVHVDLRMDPRSRRATSMLTGPGDAASAYLGDRGSTGLNGFGSLPHWGTSLTTPVYGPWAEESSFGGDRRLGLPRTTLLPFSTASPHVDRMSVVDIPRPAARARKLESTGSTCSAPMRRTCVTCRAIVHPRDGGRFRARRHAFTRVNVGRHAPRLSAATAPV